MTGKVVNLLDIMEPDRLGTQIANLWHEQDILRQNWKQEVMEIRKYVYATDTTTTTNSKLPWKNKTTIPKLCQIRDNLDANYFAAIFPKRKSIHWEADAETDEEVAEAIEAYMEWVTQQERFKKDVRRLLLDYIDYGNCVGTVEWVDERSTVSTPRGPQKVGYVGPAVRRISPIDIVFNPIAPNFTESPKVVRSLVSIGEVKKILEQETTDENREAYTALFAYLNEFRENVRNTAGDLHIQDEYLRVDGFTSYRSYIDSNYAEILTFYGDIYDYGTKEYLQNYVIQVIDRHKVILKKPNPSFFGYTPMYHVGWRPRQDNLWAQGPLANLVGMQYRLDHIENLKADVFDLIAFPVLKITGYVEPFTWQPLEKIVVSEGSDVDMVAPPFQILQVNQEMANIMSLMEELAGSPKEAMGFRTPGEKTAYEVQRLENAAARIFQNKVAQFEEQFLEPLLNAMLELARRLIDGVQTISVKDEEWDLTTFLSITPSDIAGSGRVRPLAARHFVEKAEMVQNLTNFASSPLGQDPSINVHMSGQQTAKLMADLLDLRERNIYKPFVRLSEQAEAEKLKNQYIQDIHMNATTPTGMTPDDTDEAIPPPLPPGANPGANFT